MGLGQDRPSALRSGQFARRMISLEHCASFGTGKLAKSEAVLLAQLLEKGGYGIEPDVRFGGAPLAPGGTVVVFKLPPGAVAIASPHYAAATVLLHLAVAVSAADGSISQSEEQHLEEHLQRALALGAAERLRLSAHLSWLMKSPPGLTGLKKRLEPLDQRQRSAIAEFHHRRGGCRRRDQPGRRSEQSVSSIRCWGWTLNWCIAMSMQ